MSFLTLLFHNILCLSHFRCRICHIHTTDTRAGFSGIAGMQFLVPRRYTRSGTAAFLVACSFNSHQQQASAPRGAPPPILDTSSSLLLFSAAANIAGAQHAAAALRQHASPSSLGLAPPHSSSESLPVLIERVSALLQMQQPSGISRGSAGNAITDSAAATAGLEAVAAITFCALNDCEREGTIHALTHSMVFVIIQAASGAHGHILLQRFALMALAGISMSASGRRLLLNDATPTVQPLMDTLTGGELHAAALAALALGNLALEPRALAAIEQAPAAFAREVVTLMSSEQVDASLCACACDPCFQPPTPTPPLSCRSTLFASLWALCAMWLSATSSGTIHQPLQLVLASKRCRR